MKLKLFLTAALAGMMFASCDDTTDSIGNSLINSNKIIITTDTFNVTSNSLRVDSVLSRNSIAYIGRVRDEETGAYITSNCMLQFRVPEDYSFPDKADIVSKDANGEVIVDSCKLFLYYKNFYGDSLQTMKLSVNEMDKPMLENRLYYSNFDPETAGYLRTNGLKVEKTYTLTDLSVSDSIRNSSSYTKNISIPLNSSYTDKNGTSYNNYGTYVMRKYFENPTYFKNSINLINNVIPGFYIKHVSGLGAMAYVHSSALMLYYRHQELNDSNVLETYTRRAVFYGTEEVLQTTKITNDNSSIERLVSDPTCTYVKTPAGIFTEVTLPVTDIMQGHENDTLNTAKLIINSINNTSQSNYALQPASVLMIIPKDSINSFFENNNVVDYKLSYIASHSNNAYTFSNISGIISAMYNSDKTSTDWNKAVLIPVTVTTNAQGAISKVVHNMSLTSAKLVGGTANTLGDIKISVIYSKFE